VAGWEFGVDEHSPDGESMLNYLFTKMNKNNKNNNAQNIELKEVIWI
jgi:hypothetical protein